MEWHETTWREKIAWIRGLLRKAHACGKKQRYPTVEVARKAGAAMEKKTGHKFDVYHCIWCRKWHIGHSIRYRTLP